MNDATEQTGAAAGPEPDAPEFLDLSKPSVARVYDYLLGGKDHYAVDRQAAHAFMEVLPEPPQVARSNRALVRRGVRYLVGEAGIRQFIDIGSGLPTAGNVHEIAHEVDPDARVVYVDNDPVVLAHGRALLADNKTTTVIRADIRDPSSIFDDPTTRAFIDATEPFAVLAAGVLHFVSDEEDPEGLVATIKSRIPSEGYLLVTNFLDSGDPRARELERIFLESGLGTGRFRTWDEQARYFEGLEIVEPGLVFADDWRPDDLTPRNSPVRTLLVGGVGRKP